RRMGRDQRVAYRGVCERAPCLALALAFCLVSLTGIPPTAGFWGKLYIFNAGIRADLAWLVIIRVLNTVIFAYFYLGVVRQMFLGDATGEEPVRTTPSIGLSLGVATLGVF